MKQVLTFAVAAMLMVSCSKSENQYDPQAKEKTQMESYAENFVAKYGNNPDQTWDFTKGARLGTRADGVISAELIEGLDFGIVGGDTITKNKPIFDAIKNILPEKQKQEGEPAVLVTPSSTFYIFPISTQSGWLHKLKIKVGNNDVMQLYDKTWNDFRKPYVNGMRIPNSEDIVSMKGLKIEAPIGTPIQIYLDEQKCDGVPRSSVGAMNGQAIYVDVPKDVKLDLSSHGIELQEDAIIKYVGIEDILVDGDHGDVSDQDFNDVVLAIVGNPDVPEEIVVTEDEYVAEYYTIKRYMIEDLGSTNDFDFNDVVVDVIETVKVGHKITKENGVVVKDEETSTAAEQKAIVRALGGTLDLTLKIGNTEWKKSAKLDASKMYNTEGAINYDAVLDEFPVYGWQPTNNNVSIVVNQNKSNEVFTIQFPKKGAAPMIIAVEPEVKWMSERVSVPKSWFYTTTPVQ